MFAKSLLLKIVPSRLLKVDGYAFQQFFSNVMKERYGDEFETLKPYGSYGDFKVDGFLRNGTYFAVYGPIGAELNHSKIMKKLESDLNGLISNLKKGIWPDEMKEFTFVVNLKFQDEFPSIVVQRKKFLEKEHNIKINLWNQVQIIKILDQLELDQLRRIMDMIYIDSNFEIKLDAQCIAQVIESLINYPYLINKNVKEPLNFDEKIKLNNLNYINSVYLNNAYLSLNKLEIILKNYRTFSEEEISNKIINLYLEAKAKFDNQNDQFNYVFVNIYDVDNLEVDAKFLSLINDAKMVILAKYFENCSIFESNNKGEK